MDGRIDGGRLFAKGVGAHFPVQFGEERRALRRQPGSTAVGDRS